MNLAAPAIAARFAWKFIGATVPVLVTATGAGALAADTRQYVVSSGGASEVALFEAALRIGDYGQKAKDPIALIAAARIILEVGGTYRAEAMRRGNGLPPGAKPAPDRTTRSTVSSHTPDERFLSDARSLARGDATVLALIDRVTASRTRGRQDGPGKWQGRVDGRSYVELDVEFKAHELAEVVAVGDGETDIDLIVFDRHGAVVCKSARDHDRESCRWAPTHPGPFTVRIVNYGGIWSFVTVVTN